ncbi:MAG TPA: hypothetical protein VFA41_00770 [Ktedonobacteraceae bacterium]|jgi:rRNA processing protein Krr1/Pno1|nr:hypothetical protein [Ktedonobacteraceae bacterium]
MKNNPLEHNERSIQHAELKAQTANISSEQQVQIAHLIGKGFSWEEALNMISLREHLYENAEMRQRIAENIYMQFARWLYEQGELSE